MNQAQAARRYLFHPLRKPPRDPLCNAPRNPARTAARKPLRAWRARRCVLALSLLLAACALPSRGPGDGAPASPALTPADIRVRVIAFNDLHGNLRSPGKFQPTPSSSPVPAGGVDALAAYVRQLRADSPHAVVVAAGDLVGASPLDSALFHDEAIIEALNRLGLDLSSVGNHEFDAGRLELLRKQHGGCSRADANTCQGQAVGTPVPFEGARFEYLAANVIDEASGQTLFPAYAIRRFEGVPVAFIGMTLAATPSIVTPAGVAGLRFADEADTVNALIPQLHAQGVHAIVVLIHQGGFQGAAAGAGPASSAIDINACVGELRDETLSPIRAIVGRFDPGVDLVVSGHTHTAYNCRLPDRSGHLVPVTQAASYGRVITAIDLMLDPATGTVRSASARNEVVDRSNPAVTPDAGIAALVARYDALAAPLQDRVIGSIAAAVPNTPSAAGELPAGDLIADAQLQATAAPERGGSRIAFMNPGGVRAGGLTGPAYPHPVSYGEAFTLQPFGNSLVVMDLSARQIKDLLEQQFAGCMGQTTTRILQVSRGLRETWRASAPPCQHVVELQLAHDGTTDAIVADGVAADPARIYRVTVNSYLASGGDRFTVLAQGTHVIGGAQDIDALGAYLAQYLAPQAPYEPVAAARITRQP